MNCSTVVKALMLAILLPVASRAQQFRVGVIGGAGFTDLEVSIGPGIDVPTDGRRRLAIGGIAELSITEIFSLRLTPTYIRSASLLHPPDPGSVDLEFGLSHIELPILFTVSTPTRIQPFVSAGPVVSYLLTSEVTGAVFGVEFAGDGLPVTRRWQLGVAASAGARTAVGPVTVFWEGRYSCGLTDLHRSGSVLVRAGPLSDTIDFPEPGEMRTRVFSLLAGATIPL